MTKVSVVIPVYNVEDYLEECLDSIVNQTLKDIEIICINDGSSDNSLRILENYAEKDSRIKVFSQENSGLSASRNQGIKLSQGEYVYFIDSDDYLELEALEELYNMSKALDLDILIFKLINFDDGSHKKYTSNYYEMSFLKPYEGKTFNYGAFGEKILDVAVSAPGKFFKNSLIFSMKFPEGLIFEDNHFFAEAMLKAKRVSFLDKHFYNRRIRSDSITTTKTIKFADTIIISNKIMDLFKEYGVYDKFKKRFIEKKINSTYNRFSQVDESFKEEFFNRIKEDCKNHEKEFKNDFVFREKVHPRSRHIFNAALKSENYKQFELKVGLFNQKERNRDLTRNIEMPKVSVVMPVYNVGYYLEDSLSTLLNQTLEDIEIICVNDGSSDNSLEILEDFAKRDSRVKIINQENRGAGIARNNGMEMAKGEYIHFIDADDIVTEDILEKLYDNAINNDSDFVVFKVARFDEKGINYDYPIFNLEKIFPGVDFNNFSFTHLDIKRNVFNASFAPWTKFYKREFFEKNNLEFPDISSFNDVLIHVQSMLKSSKISFVPEFLYFYRLDNVNSITNDPSKHFNIFHVIKSVEDFLIEENFMEDYKNEFELFKINQISRHMVVPVSEEYFKRAKEEFLKIDVSNNPLIKRWNLEKYNVTLNLSIEDINKFEDYLNLAQLKNKNYYLEKSIKKLYKNHNKHKDLHKDIYTSYSWKLTKFYKKNYSKLKKSNIDLNKRNARLEEKYDKISNEKKQLIKEKKQLIGEKKQLIKEKEVLIEEKTDLNDILDSVLKYVDNVKLDVPKVSVIIPVYNVEKYLSECLDSVVNQTLKDIEIICVNDGSTDNSLAILESFSESDDRIKIFSQENMGVAASRNRGIKLSQGEYIYFIDSEDYIELDMLEELYHNAIFNDSNIVISKIALFNDQSYEIDLSFPGFDFEKILGDVNFNNFNFDYADVKKYVLNASFAPCMKLFKREFIVENDFAFLENKAFEDILFHVRTFLNANRISFSPNCYYYYRNPKSIRNTPKSGFYIDLFKVINMVKDYLVNENYYDEFKEEFCLFKVIQILNYILMGSEDYFQMAKEELSKIKGVNNLKISEENLKRLELVLKSNSFEEYKDFLINEKNKYH